MYILTLSLPLPQSLPHNTLSHSVAPAYDVGGLGGRTQVRTEAKTHAQTEDTQTHTHTHTCRVSVSSSRPNQTTTRWRRRPHAVKGKSKLKSVIRFGPNSCCCCFCCRRCCRCQSQLRQRVRSLHLTCAHTVLTATVSTLLKLHCTVNTVAAGCAVHCGGGGAQVL